VRSQSSLPRAASSRRGRFSLNRRARSAETVETPLMGRQIRAGMVGSGAGESATERAPKLRRQRSLTPLSSKFVSSRAARDDANGDLYRFLPAAEFGDQRCAGGHGRERPYYRASLPCPRAIARAVAGTSTPRRAERTIGSRIRTTTSRSVVGSTGTSAGVG
jgi:hypothetical protein